VIKSKFNWHSLENSAVVAEVIFQQIKILSQQAIENKGQFKIVLAGGTTPGLIYKKLVDLKTDWSKWRIFFGDERCLDAENADRNSKMANDLWLNLVAIPDQNIHIMQAHLGAKSAAQLYQVQIDSALPFDLVLNGMGEDGHTASLFPQQFLNPDINNSLQSVLAIYNSPKPPSDRVSLSTKTLSSTYKSFIIITGVAKYPAVKLWKNGESFPINQLSCLDKADNKGEVDIYIDQGALTGKKI
jgi:6-phosphogluconolactonase